MMIEVRGINISGAVNQGVSFRPLGITVCLCSQVLGTTDGRVTPHYYTVLHKVHTIAVLFGSIDRRILAGAGFKTLSIRTIKIDARDLIQLLLVTSIDKLVLTLGEEKLVSVTLNSV